MEKDRQKDHSSVVPISLLISPVKPATASMMPWLLLLACFVGSDLFLRIFRFDTPLA